jgi:ABC-2 type transport system permease protein
MEKIRNVFVIAQKEFADNVWSPRFIMLILIFTAIVFSFSYQAGMYTEDNIFRRNFIFVVQVIAVFLPLIGIALGFDAMIKERESGSLNVLLTHPVFRDNIITGKILGSMITLALVVCVSIATVVGTMLMISGTELSLLMLNRLFIFTVLTYLYLSIFTALGMLTSIISKSATNSLIYGIAVWIGLCVVFGLIIASIASITTGQMPLDLGNNDRFLEFNADLQKLSPTHHYAETVMGVHGFSWGGVSRAGMPTVHGIFDTEHTLKQWWNEYWTNVVILLITPIILLIMSFILFLRQDISKNVG